MPSQQLEGVQQALLDARSQALDTREEELGRRERQAAVEEHNATVAAAEAAAADRVRATQQEQLTVYARALVQRELKLQKAEGEARKLVELRCSVAAAHAGMLALYDELQDRMQHAQQQVDHMRLPAPPAGVPPPPLQSLLPIPPVRTAPPPCASAAAALAPVQRLAAPQPSTGPSCPPQPRVKLEEGRDEQRRAAIAPLTAPLGTWQQEGPSAGLPEVQAERGGLRRAADAADAAAKPTAALGPGTDEGGRGDGVEAAARAVHEAEVNGGGNGGGLVWPAAPAEPVYPAGGTASKQSLKRQRQRATSLAAAAATDAAAGACREAVEAADASMGAAVETAEGGSISDDGAAAAEADEVAADELGTEADALVKRKKKKKKRRLQAEAPAAATAGGQGGEVEDDGAEACTGGAHAPPEAPACQQSPDAASIADVDVEEASPAGHHHGGGGGGGGDGGDGGGGERPEELQKKKQRGGVKRRKKLPEEGAALAQDDDAVLLTATVTAAAQPVSHPDVQARASTLPAQANAHCTVRIATDQDLVDQIGSTRLFDLVDHALLPDSGVFRLKANTRFSLIKTKVAERLGVPVQQQRYWLWVRRQNGTFRPMRPLSAEEEAGCVSALLHIGEAAVPAPAERTLPLELCLFLETPPHLSTALCPRGAADILLFIKVYDPVLEQLKYVGRAHFHKATQVRDMIVPLLHLARLDVAAERSVLVYEEVAFEPSVMCEPLQLSATLEQEGQEDGDILCIEVAPDLERAAKLRHPTISSFYQHQQPAQGKGRHNSTDGAAGTAGTPGAVAGGSGGNNGRYLASAGGHLSSHASGELLGHGMGLLQPSLQLPSAAALGSAAVWPALSTFVMAGPAALTGCLPVPAADGGASASGACPAAWRQALGTCQWVGPHPAAVTSIAGHALAPHAASAAPTPLPGAAPPTQHTSGPLTATGVAATAQLPSAAHLHLQQSTAQHCGESRQQQPAAAAAQGLHEQPEAGPHNGQPRPTAVGAFVWPPPHWSGQRPSVPPPRPPSSPYPGYAFQHQAPQTSSAPPPSAQAWLLASGAAAAAARHERSWASPSAAPPHRPGQVSSAWPPVARSWGGAPPAPPPLPPPPSFAQPAAKPQGDADTAAGGTAAPVPPLPGPPAAAAARLFRPVAAGQLAKRPGERGPAPKTLLPFRRTLLMTESMHEVPGNPGSRALSEMVDSLRKEAAGSGVHMQE